ncbi:MAG: hypothetical protein A2878_02965 [Candidatus Moranbacteria bacterium RIFCSPHIGHO2_01_FULL_54_31]|nr:MAG: hypothetical protein A2878_02965 [Candidatus Moranbacteria bacterium RIFCSPHIGHO2_01_FULL_54_31]
MKTSDIKRVIMIGAGGIGTLLAPPLARYLRQKCPKATFVLIDGDQFEPKNEERQEFDELGNKAEVTAARLQRSLPGLAIEAKPRFVTADNVFVLIPEKCFVFSCVDNHATRKLLSEHCATLKDVVLISGGNGFDDGNVQVYIRRSGKDVTPPLTHLHPEIARPADRNPDEMSCEERAAAGTPQLAFANLTVAANMANAFYAVTEVGVVYSELYFDIKTGQQRPVLRTNGS